MKLSEAIHNIHQINWSMNNTFEVEITNIPDAILKIFNENGFDIRNINLNVVSVTTPVFSNNPIEVIVANRWRIQNGMDNLYEFSITFRDQDQMNLYKIFHKIYYMTRENYFDNISMTFNITKNGDWAGETDKQFFQYQKTIVSSVGNINISNISESQIAEFDVTFKCIQPVSVLQSKK